MRVIYETGIETPEIMGSGSTYSNVVTTRNEEEARDAYANGRNYLFRYTYETGKPRIMEWWDNERKCWRE